jgi:hypothetical protein
MPAEIDAFSQLFLALAPRQSSTRWNRTRNPTRARKMLSRRFKNVFMAGSLFDGVHFEKDY